MNTTLLDFNYECIGFKETYMELRANFTYTDEISIR